jgi:hypothetical protein
MTITEQFVHDWLKRFSVIVPDIKSFTRDYDDARLRVKSGENEWSVHDVLDHLRASYDIISYRMYAVLVRDNPPLPAFDERQWALVARYARLPFHQSLETFSRIREELLMMLRSLAVDDWQRIGQHAVHGTMTLFDMFKNMVEHEKEHCQQIEMLLKQE